MCIFVQVKPVKGLNWGHAVIGNATWSGPRLRDVLQYVGVNDSDPKIQHVQVSRELFKTDYQYAY